MQAVEFEGFFKENYSKIYCYAHSLVRDDEAARDIVADSFEYLFTHNPHLSKSEASNYLFAIVRKPYISVIPNTSLTPPTKPCLPNGRTTTRRWRQSGG